MAREVDISQGPFWQLIGMKLVSKWERGCTLELEVQEKNLHSYRRAHGGTIASLVDSAIGFAAHEYLSPDQGSNAVQLNVNFVRPAYRSEILKATSELIHCGRTTIVGVCRIVDSHEKLVAYGSATLVVRSLVDFYRKRTIAGEGES